MVNAEDILNQKFLLSLEENSSKQDLLANINYVNRTLAGLIQNLYDDHWIISPMDIEESEKKMKQELLFLDPLVDLFEKIDEGVEFVEAASTPTPGGKVVNIAYLKILRIRGMEKAF